MNVFDTDCFARHLENRHGIAQQLFDGILPVFIVSATAAAFVLAHVDDFQVEVDQIFNLSAATAGSP